MLDHEEKFLFKEEILHLANAVAEPGILDNVEDLLAFSDELVHPRLLHPDTAAAALAPQFPDLAGVLPGWGAQDPCPWGLGPELRGTKSPHWTGTTAAPGTYGHFGGSGTLFWIDPVAGVRCIAFPNENTAEHDFTQAERRVERLEFSDVQSAVAAA